ncbi:hypothetical protein EJB05_10251, partial [Eragrostis curvula]
MVRPLTSTPTPPPTANGNGEEEVEVIHLTPWDLRLISVDYIQKGILLPKPPVHGDALVEALQTSFARALGQFYSFAGRLGADERDDDTVTLSLRCTGDGAEFVHAAAPEVTVADITAPLYTPPVVWALFPMAQVLGADAALWEPLLPLVAVQVTELADGAVFIGMSLSHAVADGTAFWRFFNIWSEIHRRGELPESATPPAGLQRWYVETSPVPIPARIYKFKYGVEQLDHTPPPVPMPFPRLQDIVRRFEPTAVQECFFTFSTASVRKLQARANAEVAAGGGAAISPLQAVLAHLWRALCRARRLPPDQGTFYSVVVGFRSRVNAMVFGKAEATAGEIEEKGLGWTALLLNSAMASIDESLELWVWEPDFTYMANLSSGGTALVTGFDDVFGNDFGWGKPLAVRSGSGNKADGKATVFEGPQGGGSMWLEVCIAPDALARLVADEEFMEAVSKPA